MELYVFYPCEGSRLFNLDLESDSLAIEVALDDQDVFRIENESGEVIWSRPVSKGYLKYQHGIELVDPLADKYGWEYDSTCEKTYRVSYLKGMYRADIYLSTMTIGLIVKKGRDVFFRKKDIGMVELILKRPDYYAVYYRKKY